MPRPTLLLDLPSLVYRAYFALPNSIRSPAGRPVNAVRGYMDFTSRLLTDRAPRGIVHAFDLDWKPAFRVAAYPAYKAARREDPPDLPPQFTVIRDVLEAAGMPLALAPGYEADDALGTLAARATADAPVEIVTGDRDLLQVVRDDAATVLFTVRGVSDLRRFDEAAVEEAYGVPAGLYADMAILRGDPSDGLPGVRGIGPATAAHIVRAAGGIAALLENPSAAGRFAERILACRQYLEAMLVVVPIPTDIEMTLTPATPPDLARCAALAEEHGLRGAMDRLLVALSRGEGAG